MGPKILSYFLYCTAEQPGKGAIYTHSESFNLLLPMLQGYTWFNRCYNHTIVAYAVSVRQASKAVSEGGSGSVRLCQRREAVRKAVLGSGRSVRG